MANLREKSQKVLDKANVQPHRKGDDTIRIWEGYRQQAVMWRALSIIQLLATTAISILCIILWQTRQITLKVPQRPVPGQYNTQEIPDADFVEAANSFVSLIATFQPYTSEEQFKRAAALIHSNLLERFTDEFLDNELKAINATSLSQVFFVDPSKTTIERFSNNTVRVTLYGVRHKYIGGREIEPVKSKYVVILTTLPRNDLNPLGIVVTDVILEKVQN
ncbi:MAG: TraE/TraK family type IV conjugative transfer system protein [Bdellovibrionota bacterium]|jgi:hypothetical protein